MRLIPKNPDLRQYGCVIIANLSIVSMGLSVVWASPMLVKLRDEDNPVLSRPLTDDEEAWIASLSVIVGVVALFCTSYVIEFMGQKTTLLACHVPRFTFCLLVIFATEPWMILLGRALVGISDTLSLAVVSTYNAEIAGKNIRGASGTVTEIGAALGMLIMFGVGPFVSYLAMNVLMTCIMFAIFVLLWFIPDSPYHMYKKGHSEKSIEILTFLYGSEEEAHRQFQEYSNVSLNTEVNKWELLKDRTTAITLAKVLFLSVGLQMVGYNAINFYLQTIFESTQTSLSPEYSSLIIGFIQLIASGCTFFLTDRFGRKPILCISLIGMFFGLVALGTFFYILDGGNEITGFLNVLPLLSIIVVIYGYNAGMGSLFWILVAELFDGPFRSYGIFAGVFTSTLSTFLLTRFFGSLTDAIGAAATYWMFATNCIIVCVFIYFLVPETKGKTFAEIQKEMRRQDQYNDKKQIMA